VSRPIRQYDRDAERIRIILTTGRTILVDAYRRQIIGRVSRPQENMLYKMHPLYGTVLDEVVGIEILDQHRIEGQE
jgi:hypothetical protein